MVSLLVAEAAKDTKSLRKHDGWAVLAIDMTDAFPSTPHFAILTQLAEHGVPRPIVEWVAKTLDGRTMRVANGPTTNELSLEVGYPQGGILGPMYWSVTSAPLTRELSEILATRTTMPLRHAPGYADDLSVILRGSVQSIVNALHAVAGVVTRWTLANRFSISTKTTLTTSFDWPAQRPLVLGDAGTIAPPTAPSSKVIGFVVDESSARAMAHECVTRFWSEFATLCALGNSVPLDQLRHMYSAICLPCITKHLPAIRTLGGKSAIALLDQAHAQALKTLTGAVSNSRSETVVLEAGFPTIEGVLDSIATSTASRCRALANPTAAKLRAMLPSSDDWKVDVRPTEADLTHCHLPTDSPLASPEDALGWQNVTTLPLPCDAPDTDTEKAQANMATIDKLFDEHPTATLLLTDGSRIDERCGGAAILLPAGVSEPAEVATAAAASHSCSMTCEAAALLAGLELLCEPRVEQVNAPASTQRRALDPRTPLIVLTDSMSLLKHMAKGPLQCADRLITDVWRALCRIGRLTKVILAFVYSHCEDSVPEDYAHAHVVRGLTTVDEAAKAAALGSEQDLPAVSDPRRWSLERDWLASRKHARRVAARRGAAAQTIRRHTKHDDGRPIRWRDVPGKRDARVVMQCLTGSFPALGGHLFNRADACPRCGDKLQRGDGAPIVHMTECKQAAAARRAMRGVRLDTLYSSPAKFARYARWFTEGSANPPTRTEMPDTSSDSKQP